MWAVPAVRLDRLAVVVFAATSVQVLSDGVVRWYHHFSVQFARFSVAVFCPTEVAVRPTVENSASVELVVSSFAGVQLLSLYAFQV